MRNINTLTRQHLNTFLSCDWGTSSFRLTLATWDGAVRGVVSNGNGIAATFQKWKERSGGESERFDFYLNVIREAIAEMQTRLDADLQGVPLIISGMASSSIGMMNLPYGNIPFSLDGSGLEVHRMEANESFPHPMYLISGVRSENDVMRGEETQLMGVADAVSNKNEHLYIFPGTHSKHIRVVDGSAIAFTTYMTGEFFEVLSKKSILADSVSEGGILHHTENLDSFREGVSEGMRSNILNSAFHVRTRALLHGRGKESNYYFLSGLLIGSEVSGITGPVTITGSLSILSLYEEAFRVSGVSDVTLADGEQAVIKGQARIALP
ncbi:MAG TPA: 2-dehydro-3-deoxygalactonokinase [Cyclobacteriaceae bacterium]